MYAVATSETQNEAFVDESNNRESADTENASGIVERLKDEFGDYSDPLMYDWSWREQD